MIRNSLRIADSRVTKRRPVRLHRVATIVLALATTAMAEVATELEILPLETRPLPGARADVAALLLSGSDLGSLELSALAIPSPSGSGVTGVDFWLEIAGEPLLEILASNDSETRRLELYAYAMTRAGELAGHSSRRIRLSREEHADKLRAGRLMLAGRLETEPVEVQLHLMAREPKSGRFALRVLQLDVATPVKEAPPIPEELWPTAGEAWIVSGVTKVAPGAADPAPNLEPPPPLELDTRAARRLETISEGYRSVLRRLASGDSEAAVSELIQLEADVLAGAERGRGRGWLESAQERVIDDLAGLEVESLLPLIALHLETHDRYLEQSGTDPLLPGAARRRVQALARTYSEEADHDLAATLAASALADLGVATDRAGLPMASNRLLEEALALDARHRSALLYLAYWYELRGAYGDAAPLLRRLIEVEPGSHQGRLRLALSLRRLGEAERASNLLRQLIRDASANIWLTLAYQELARLQMEQGQTEGAVAVLEEAVARLPGQQRLYIQLAYLLERLGSRQRAREVIERLPSDPGPLSPRNLYSRRPRSDASESRSELARHATARLPFLSAALNRASENSR